MTETSPDLRVEDVISPQSLKGKSVKTLERFAQNVRTFLLNNISETGGHIGANLGTVELSIALHVLFDSPDEPIIWDTGHQGYTHKLITGRAHLFSSLNTYGGMNRFVTRTESDHDIIEASHAGTSISIASGIAMARRIKGDDRRVIAVIGDSALAEGLALEALNHVAVEKIALTIVVNDNGYAISPGFGGLHEAFQNQNERAKDLFTAWGLNYIGPVDGHNMTELLDAFKTVRESSGVNVVHVKTIKGKGWKPADGHPFRMHFSFPFNKENGSPRMPPPGPAYQDVAAATILEEMGSDESIVCITPSTLYATGMAPIFSRYADRCFDPGMEEQHALTLGVGMALGGMKPVVAYQSTFLQRAFDQLLHDVCFMALPILLLGLRSGFAGYDNPTHHGVYDFPYLRGMPNLKILYPKDRYETERMVRDELRGLSGPILILMPYGPVDDFEPQIMNESAEHFALPQVILEGSDVLVVTVGNKFAASRMAVELLRKDGVDAGLVNLRCLKPLAEATLIELFKKTSHVVTVEEYVRDGGVGGAIAEIISDRELDCRVLRIALPTAFIEPGSNIELEQAYGLDGPGIYAQIRDRWAL